MPEPFHSGTPPRLLLTAGPTWEPIDRVRYVGNRSSGKLGISLAQTAASLGWPVTLLLGPTGSTPHAPGIRLLRFERAAELQDHLHRELDEHDILVMAAAVADYAPKSVSETKLRRDTTSPLTIELVPTPDLLAGAAADARPDQLLVGFALEPEADLEQSARAKLARKNIDAIVANPLDTIDADDIRPTLLLRDQYTRENTEPGVMSKAAFARWLLTRLHELLNAKRSNTR